MTDLRRPQDKEPPVVINVLPILGKWLLIVFGTMGVITIAATAYLEYF